MSILSVQFFAFLFAVVLVYYLAPKKYQWIVLLSASLIFYAFSGPVYILYLLFSSAVSFFIAKNLDKLNSEMKFFLSEETDKQIKKDIKQKYTQKKRKFIIFGIVLVLTELVVVKYTSFILGNIGVVFGTDAFDAIKIIAPLGCSFYTFAIIGYMTDVYKNKVAAQTNYLKFLLFVSYFPQIVQGPIPRFNKLSPQFFAPKKFEIFVLKNGTLRILWGVFKKLAVAQTISPMVEKVYSDSSAYNGTIILFVTLLYSIQMYADFSGYVDIVAGASEIFGIKLEENFNQPYFAKTIPEFWRRWHISLSSWFREYVFYAMSSSKGMLKLNKKTRKKFGNEAGRIISVIIPVLSVWMLTGLWHGAAWNYILWGFFHGILIMLSIIFSPYFKKIEQKSKFDFNNKFFNFLKIIRTFLLCTLGRIFFRAENVKDALSMFAKVFCNLEYPKGFFSLSLNTKDFVVLAVAAVFILICSILRENKGSFREWYWNKSIYIRWGIVLLLIGFTIIFGSYGPGQASSFIYEQF